MSIFPLSFILYLAGAFTLLGEMLRNCRSSHEQDLPFHFVFPFARAWRLRPNGPLRPALPASARAKGKGAGRSGSRRAVGSVDTPELSGGSTTSAGRFSTSWRTIPLLPFRSGICPQTYRLRCEASISTGAFSRPITVSRYWQGGPRE